MLSSFPLTIYESAYENQTMPLLPLCYLHGQRETQTIVKSINVCTRKPQSGPDPNLKNQSCVYIMKRIQGTLPLDTVVD